MDYQITLVHVHYIVEILFTRHMCTCARVQVMVVIRAPPMHKISRATVQCTSKLMATNFAETWQSCAFQLPDYTKGKIYSALLSLFMNNERFP